MVRVVISFIRSCTTHCGQLDMISHALQSKLAVILQQQLNPSYHMWVACRSGAPTTINSYCRRAAGPAAGQYSQGCTHACITKAASKARASPASPDHSSCVQERGSNGICAWSHSCGYASPPLWSAPESLLHDHAYIVLNVIFQSRLLTSSAVLSVLSQQSVSWPFSFLSPKSSDCCKQR